MKPNSRLAGPNMRAIVGPIVRALCAAAIALGATPGIFTPPVAEAAAGWFTVNSEENWIGKNDVLTLAEALRVVNGTLTGPFTDAEKAQLGGCTFASSSLGWYIASDCGPGYHNTITFAPTVSKITLSLQTLPTISTDNTVILGASGVPVIDAAGNPNDVFTINANHVWISGISVINGDNSSASDIRIQGGMDANIAGNYLGTVPGATSCAPAGVSRNSKYGIYIDPNSNGAAGPNNAVAFIFDNTIGCHANYGVLVWGADYVAIGLHQDMTTSGGNYIGVTSSGSNIANGLDGVSLWQNGADGVRLNQIKYNTIKYNTRNGIMIYGNGTNSSSATYLNIITNNSIFNNGNDGIYLSNGAYATIVGLTASDQNKIGDNGDNGIEIESSESTAIYYNYIGTDGLFGRSNGNRGVFVNLHSDNTVIGNNTISGNYKGVGEAIETANSDGTIITGNLIGTNPTGVFAIPNGTGILIGDSANARIGGLALSDRNLISGNTGYAIKLLNSGTHLSYVDNNLIGLKITGDAPVPNGGGILIAGGAYSNTIGSTSTPAIQYISGNSGDAITMQNTYSNTVAANTIIGLAVGNINPLGNGGYGIYLSNSHDNRLAPSWVNNNAKGGISIAGTSSNQNSINVGQFKGNGGLPVDLGNDGITLNGSHSAPGPNDWLPYPRVTSYTSTSASGTTCAYCMVIIFSYDSSTNSYAYAGAVATGVSGSWSSSAGAGTRRVFQACQAGCSWLANASELSPLESLYLPLTNK